MNEHPFLPSVSISMPHIRGMMEKRELRDSEFINQTKELHRQAFDEEPQKRDSLLESEINPEDLNPTRKLSKSLPRCFLVLIAISILPLVVAFFVFGSLRLDQEDIELLESIKYLALTPPLATVSISNSSSEGHNPFRYWLPPASGVTWYKNWFESVQEDSDDLKIGKCNQQTELSKLQKTYLSQLSSLNDLSFHLPFRNIYLEYFSDSGYQVLSGYNQACPQEYPKKCGLKLCVKSSLSCPIESFSIEPIGTSQNPSIQLNSTSMLTWKLMGNSSVSYLINLSVSTGIPSINLKENAVLLETEYPCFWEPLDPILKSSSQFSPLATFSFYDISKTKEVSNISEILMELGLDQDESPLVFLGQLKGIHLGTWDASQFLSFFNEAQNARFINGEAYVVIQYLKLGSLMIISVFFEFGHHKIAGAIAFILSLVCLIQGLVLTIFLGGDFRLSSLLREASEQLSDAKYKEEMESMSFKLFVSTFTETIFPFLQFLFLLYLSFHLGYCRNKKRTGMF